MSDINIYHQLTMLSLAEKDDLPFAEVAEQHTKEECFAMVRKCYVILENAGCGPYTLFRFKQECNNIARTGGRWEEYYGQCAKYLEFHVYKKKNRQRIY